MTPADANILYAGTRWNNGGGVFTLVMVTYHDYKLNNFLPLRAHCRHDYTGVPFTVALDFFTKYNVYQRIEE